MGIQFTSDARPPSNTQLLPNRFLRPAFGELYGFDADADEAEEGATPFTNTYSVSFDGSNDFMSTDFGLTPSSYSAYSFGGWVYFNAFTSGAGPFNVVQGTNWNSWTSNTFIRVNSATSILIYHTDDSTYRHTSVPYTLSLNTWHHFVQVWDGSDVKLYIDGALRGTLASVTSWRDFGNNVRFSAGRGRSGYYNCLVDEAIWFSSALSASDVTSIYNNGTPNDISSLNPVGWWRMGDNDSGTGTTITDQGSGGNNGTLTNGPTFSTNVPQAPIVLPSITNTYSVSFDGVDDYVTMSNPTSLNFQGSFTISLWVMYTNISSSFNFLVDKSTDVTTRQYSLYLRDQTTGTKTFSFYGVDSVGNQQFFNSTGSIAVNTWNHVAVVCNSGVTDGTKLYINGVAETLGTFTVASNASAPFQLGKRSDNSYLHQGLMDEVAVFDSALAASYIASIYNNGVPNDISSLNPVGWWRMGDNGSGSGTTITDQGSGGNNGTLTNGPTFSTTVP